VSSFSSGKNESWTKKRVGPTRRDTSVLAYTQTHRIKLPIAALRCAVDRVETPEIRRIFIVSTTRTNLSLAFSVSTTVV